MITSTKTAALLTLSLGIALLTPKTTKADNVTDLFNTGVNASGAVLPDGTSPDPHYTIVVGVDGSIASPTLVHQSNPTPPYVAPNTTSAWIEAAPETTLGHYDYQTSFTLPAGATNLVITGGVAVDNSLNGVLINGINVGSYAATPASLTALTANGSAAFTAFNPVSFSIPDIDLLTGTNTLTFLTANDAGTGTGFRFDASLGTYTPSSSGTTAPEPMSLSLLALGSSSLLLRRRRTRITAW